MRFLIALVLFIARVCLAAVFITAGIGKFMFFDQTSAYMAAKGFPVIPLFLVVAALVEIVGGLILVFGYRTRFGALILALFLIPTTIIFHNFWDLTGAEQSAQQTMFFKNVAIFGGLLYVLCHGAGVFSIDHLSRKKIVAQAKMTEPTNPPGADLTQQPRI